MSKVPLRELRRYRELFDAADVARDPRELGVVAQDADQSVDHWLLLRSLKDKLAERARGFGIRCRDSDRCFDDLISRVQTRPLFRQNPARDQTSTELVDWAIGELTSGTSHATRRVSTDDGRILDVELTLHPSSKFDVRGHFWGPQDRDAAWRGRVELGVWLPRSFRDDAELRAVLARTIRHELEHAHDVDVPAAPAYDGDDPFEAFCHYVLSPREVSAWGAHMTDEARRESVPMDDLLEGNRAIIERGAVARGATGQQAQDLAHDAVAAWRGELGLR